MSKLASIARRIVRNEEGATMVEYALMVALIAVVVIAGATLLGNSVNAKFSTVAGNVSGAS
jgi:pilus assembly protein Flp/PilA